MFSLNKIYDRLQRKTNTTAFIPQIDGLRFLAILLVVLYHINGFVANKLPFVLDKHSASFRLTYALFDDYGPGLRGVLIFFVISGFILALPFAKHFWQQGKEVKLKNYFMRRLTRLEPPYIFNILVSAVLLVFFARHEFAGMFSSLTFRGLFPSVASSLVYMHNIIFPNNLSINPVAWSLEIEVQFYILVPLLVLVLKAPKFYRRIALVAAVFFFIFFQHLFPLKMRTLYSFIQYFLLGFLLVDVYLSGFKLKLNTVLSGLLGGGLLFGTLYVNLYRSAWEESLFAVLLFSFFALVLSNELWQKIFRTRFLTAIGGMCYSIYLWHDIILSGAGNKTVMYNFSHAYPLALLGQLIILLPIILIISTFFYLFIEQPCMDRNWPLKLWDFIKVKFGFSN
jgi:peptidoglycan/LPS O-acetylase OafA/YrhL